MVRPGKAWRPEHDSGQKRPLEEVISEQRPELGEEGGTQKVWAGPFPRQREEEGPRPAGGTQSGGTGAFELSE